MVGNPVKKIKNAIKNHRFVYQLKNKIMLHVLQKKTLTDKDYLIEIGKSYLGYKMDLDNPQTLNEKINWYKLNYHDEKMVVCVDKIKVCEYVSQKGFSDLVVPKIASWNLEEDIPFMLLPKEFVIKSNNDSGGVIICRDKEKFDINQYRRLCNSLKHNYGNKFKEWPYEKVPLKIFAEQLLPLENDKVPVDYKFFCSRGKAKFFIVCYDRETNTKIDFYDCNKQKLSLIRMHPNSDYILDPSVPIEEMIHVAESLSQDFPFVRVDLYYVAGRIYFGELTFFPGAGMEPFKEYSMDRFAGNYLDFFQ